MDGWMNEWLINRWWIDNGWLDEWMNEWMIDGWMFNGLLINRWWVAYKFANNASFQPRNCTMRDFLPSLQFSSKPVQVIYQFSRLNSLYPMVQLSSWSLHSSSNGNKSIFPSEALHTPFLSTIPQQLWSVAWKIVNWELWGEEHEKDEDGSNMRQP